MSLACRTLHFCEFSFYDKFKGCFHDTNGFKIQFMGRNFILEIWSI